MSLQQTRIEWTKVPSLCSHLFDNVPIHRSKAAVSFSWPFLYVLGGRSGRMVCRDFWKFNVENEQWEQIYIQDQPLLEDHASCWHRGCLYVYGGVFAHYAAMTTWREGQRRFIPVKEQRSRPEGTASSPLNVRGHTLVSCDDHIYLFGGWSDTMGVTDQMWRFDTNAADWNLMQLPKGPSARHSHSAVIYGKSMWIFGGIQTFNVLGNLWRIELDDSTSLLRCQEIKCRYSPGARYGHTACVVGQRMYMFGGYNDSGLTTDNLWSFDFIEHSWSNITPDYSNEVSDALLWPPASAFCQCVAVEPPHRCQLLDCDDDSVSIAAPFQRGAATSSSADSGYASSRLTNDSASSTGKQIRAEKLSYRNMAGACSQSNGNGSIGDRSSQSVEAHFHQQTAVDNHAYSNEDLGVAQGCDSDKEDYDRSYVLPGSVMGLYEKKQQRRRSSTAVSSKPCHIEMKSFRSAEPPQIMTKILNESDDQQISTNAASQNGVPMLNVSQTLATPKRTSIYLVGTSASDVITAPNYLNLWLCTLQDNYTA